MVRAEFSSGSVWDDKKLDYYVYVKMGYKTYREFLDAAVKMFLGKDAIADICDNNKIIINSEEVKELQKEIITLKNLIKELRGHND